METLHIREAQAKCYTLARAAENSRPTLVSRHGKPCAKIVPVADGARLYPQEMPNFANYLLAMPK